MRYFLEVAYKGTDFAGFQVQQNASTIQGEVEKALQTVLKTKVELTGSSRTDAGVHALQNYFHFNVDFEIPQEIIYNLNAILPFAIVVKSIQVVALVAHSRFHALGREYKYFITKTKNPFATDTAWFYPYTINIELLNQAAALLFQHTNYSAFAKRNTQAKSNQCTIAKSLWYYQNDLLVYNVAANRFLRGMVRGLVGTMLLVGRNKLTLENFTQIIEAKDCTKANFATPAHGLFLVKVEYPSGINSNLLSNRQSF